MSLKGQESFSLFFNKIAIIQSEPLGETSYKAEGKSALKKNAVRLPAATIYVSATCSSSSLQLLNQKGKLVLAPG